MKRRYKLLILLFISFILFIILFLLFRHNKITYVSIGENLTLSNSNFYSYKENVNKFMSKFNYSSEDYEILSLDNIIELINNNTNNVKYFLKNAKYVSLVLSSYELNNYINISATEISNYINKSCKIINEINMYNKNLLIIYLNNNKYSEIENKLITCSKNNQIIFLQELNNNFYVYKNHLYLNNDGNKYLSKIIIENLRKNN